MVFKQPRDIWIAFEEMGAKRAKEAWYDSFVGGFMGGFLLSYGGFQVQSIAGGMPGVAASDPGLVRLVAGSVFPVALILVITTGCQLFTGNTAILPCAVFAKKMTIPQLLFNWLVVLFANFLGGLFFTYIFCTATEIHDVQPYLHFTQKLADGKCAQGGSYDVHEFFKSFLKGIAANVLVTLAFYLSTGAGDLIGKIVGIYLPVQAFVSSGLEHAIANMYIIPSGVFLNAECAFWEYLVKNLIPVILGNCVGGVLFVAAPFYFLHARSSKREPPPETQLVNGKEGV